MLVTTKNGLGIKAEIKWVITDFSPEWQKKKPSESLSSPIFHVDGDEDRKWRILIFPNGLTEKEEGYISMLLQLVESPEGQASKKSCKFSLSIHNEKNGQLITTGKPVWESHAFESSHPISGIDNYLKLSTVLNYQEISVNCKLEYWNSKAACTSVFSDDDKSQNSSLKEDLVNLYGEKTSTDVCFIVGGREFKAHKTILAARSPVFAAMLNNGMLETSSDRIDVRDMAPDIFEALLRFVYTDKVDLTKIDAKNLLAASDQYLISLLKFECQVFLSSNITTENCIELLELADHQNAVYLKKSTVGFIKQRKTSMMKTESWKDLDQRNPDLASKAINGFY